MMKIAGESIWMAFISLVAIAGLVISIVALVQHQTHHHDDRYARVVPLTLTTGSNNTYTFPDKDVPGLSWTVTFPENIDVTTYANGPIGEIVQSNVGPFEQLNLNVYAAKAAGATGAVPFKVTIVPATFTDAAPYLNPNHVAAYGLTCNSSVDAPGLSIDGTSYFPQSVSLTTTGLPTSGLTQSQPFTLKLENCGTDYDLSNCTFVRYSVWIQLANYA